jgi:hypothetical protein
MIRKRRSDSGWPFGKWRVTLDLAQDRRAEMGIQSLGANLKEFRR